MKSQIFKSIFKKIFELTFTKFIKITSKIIFYILVAIFFPLIFTFFLPIFLLLEILINIKRKDKKRYLVERYNIFFILKNIKNYKEKIYNQNFPFSIVIATSAGEIATIETLFEQQDYNLLIFTTSITGREKNLIIKNSKIFYLPFPFFIYIFLVFFSIKPDSMIFLEHEFWPSYFISSILLNIPIISLQIRPSLFKKFFSSNFYTFLLSLSKIIFLTEQKEKYPKNFPFEKVKLDNIDIKTTKKIDFDLTSSYKKFAITFASTHSEEEEIFFDTIKILKNNLSKGNKNNDNFLNHHFLFIIAPRHPQRSQQLKENLRLKGIDAIFYSEIEKIFENNIKNNNENYNNENINENKVENNNENKKNLLDIKNEDNIVEKLNLDSLKGKAILVDKFGVLNFIYSFSAVTIMGGTFAELGGGHNIYEPLLKCSFVIAGPHLYNMLNIFAEAQDLKVATFSKKDPQDLAEKTLNMVGNLLNFITDENFKNYSKSNNSNNNANYTNFYNGLKNLNLIDLIISFKNSPFEKIYQSKIDSKQHILDEILKVSRIC